VGGSATAASMATSFKRNDLIVKSGAVGVMGYALGTQSGLFLAKLLDPFKPSWS